MASQAAFQVEKAVGHDGSTITRQDVTNYQEAGAGSGQTMKALVWQAKNKVEVVEVARPTILEPRDVILKVTGSTLCGSDLHLLHGENVPDPSRRLLSNMHVLYKYIADGPAWVGAR